MFINIKLGKVFKLFFIIAIILMIIVFFISLYKIFFKNSTTVSSNSSAEAIEITASNYTNFLKAVHENIDTYNGKKIHFIGYIYRVSDLADTQFILARNMIISSDNQAVVVGFLCNYKCASDFSDNSWVEITGTITKGSYHGDMPIIEIDKITTTNCPNEEYVYPPDEGFIPTNLII